MKGVGTDIAVGVAQSQVALANPPVGPSFVWKRELVDR